MKRRPAAAGRGRTRSVLVTALIAFAMVFAGYGATSASAHSGGKAVVLVRDLTLTPAGTGWQATATIADLDSGSPVRGGDVRLAPSPSAKFVSLTETAVPGQYQAPIPGLKAGSATLVLKIRTFPGGLAVAPFDKTYDPITLTAGQEAVVVSGGGGKGGGGGSTGMIVGVAGVVLLVAVLYGLFSVRRRSAVPAKAR